MTTISYQEGYTIISANNVNVLYSSNTPIAIDYGDSVLSTTNKTLPVRSSNVAILPEDMLVSIVKELQPTT